MVNGMKVTDPELLAQLNASTKVSNPEILAQLNASVPMSWPEAAESAVKRFIPSTGELAIGAVTGLPQAPQNLLNLGNAALQSVLPESVNRFMHEIAPETAKNPELLKNVIDFYKQRYGSEEGLKQAIANDPAGVMADISTIATGGGALATKLPGLAKAGAIASKFGAVTNPLAAPQYAASKVGNVVAPVIGMGAGMGGDVISELYKAGKQGGEKMAVALRNMRSPSSSEFKELVTDAQEAMSKLKQDRAMAYESGMTGINQDKTVLDFPKVQQDIQSVLSSHNRAGRPSSMESAKIQQDIQSVVDQYSQMNPAEWHTPSGLDWMKREIGEIAEKTDQGTGPRKIANEVYNVVKKQINQQAPEYSKVMKDYAEASDLLHELQGTFSLGEKARTDTAVRKLQQALRNNVNTNFGYRGELINELEKAGATNMRPRIAGQAASSWTPRGLQGASAATLAALATQNPALLAALPFQSPRLMGEGAVLAGKASNLIPNIDPKLLAQYLYQMNQPKEAQ